MSIDVIPSKKLDASKREAPITSTCFDAVVKRIISQFSDEEILLDEFPLISWKIEEVCDKTHITVFLLFHAREYLAKFTYELFSRWLIPGKRLRFPLFFSCDAILSDEDMRAFTCMEVMIELDRENDLETARSNLPMLEMELKLGSESFFHASRILEVKGLTLDEKAALVQEKLSRWINKLSDFFDVDLFHHMQEFFLLSPDAFKANRTAKHLSLVVVTFYAFSKKLRMKQEENPQKRHLIFKLMPARIQTPLENKDALGIFIGMNFLKSNDVFEESHLLKAVQNSLPEALLVTGSTYVTRSRETGTQTIYAEIEKEGGKGFTTDEIAVLKKRIPDDMKRHVEHLVSPVFMPRNEEEILKNLLTLSRELKFVRDLPQVFLSFDHQSDDDLNFTVILVRLLHEKSPGVIELFKGASSPLEFVPERVKLVGMLRGKYPKEATVLKVCFRKRPFLREDHSLDLLQARQYVIKYLQEIIGEVRDYNGGMIAKQIENFTTLKHSLGEIGKEHHFLLEKFFHSLFPIEVRSLLAPSSLKSLFTLLIEVKGTEETQFEWKEEETALFALIKIHDNAVKEKIMGEVNQLKIRWPALVLLHLSIFEENYLGYILFSEEDRKKRKFHKILEECLTFDC